MEYSSAGQYVGHDHSIKNKQALDILFLEEKAVKAELNVKEQRKHMNGDGEQYQNIQINNYVFEGVDFLLPRQCSVQMKLNQTFERKIYGPVNECGLWKM